MKVFVTGATGYIGNAVAAACSRAGHEVHGMARNKGAAARLEADEIIAVLGSLNDPSSYSPVARDCQVLIHCAADLSEQFWELDRSAIQTLLASSADTGMPRKVIVTSGVWVYGDTGGHLVNETSRLNPPTFIANRPEHEKMVLRANAGSLQTIVIRPGCVYGGSGGLTGGWFESAFRQGAARIVGDGNFRWAMVHVLDLADLYLRAAESPWGGEIFNATDRSRFTVLECARAASLAAGGTGEVVTMPLAEAIKSMGPYAECLTLNQHIDSRKAVRMLGWQPHHGGFVDGAARYCAAWKASANK